MFALSERYDCRNCKRTARRGPWFEWTSLRIECISLLAVETFGGCGDRAERSANAIMFIAKAQGRVVVMLFYWAASFCSLYCLVHCKGREV